MHELQQSESWKLLAYSNSDDILFDVALELKDIQDVSIDESITTVKKVIESYHLKHQESCADLDRVTYELVIHLTQPYRIPFMTSRMDAVLPLLRGCDSKSAILDYGGGGGKDSIIYAKLGFAVTYSDLLNREFTELVTKRFKLRALPVECVDVRDIGPRRFDIINCMDVVEHVYDVERITADIVSRMTPGGLLFMYPSFCNSWNGDHVEKNCGYVGIYEAMLQAVGLRIISREPLLCCVRERPFIGDLIYEREVFQYELYQISKKLAMQTARKSAFRLPVALMKAHYISCASEQQLRYEQLLSPVIDCLAIWRLSSHRLCSRDGV